MKRIQNLLERGISSKNTGWFYFAILDQKLDTEVAYKDAKLHCWLKVKTKFTQWSESKTTSL